MLPRKGGDGRWEEHFMSKYDPLWQYVAAQQGDSLCLSYAQIEEVLGFGVDQAFLTCKKELTAYGWQVWNLSIKGQTVAFARCGEGVPQAKAQAKSQTKPQAKLGAEEKSHTVMDALFFFDGKPEALALYEALTQRMQAALPEYTTKVQKSQISFYNRHLFAMVSLPRRKAERGILVSFGLAREVQSPRVAVATEPYPGRWTHHLPVTDAAQLDEELLGWLREAYDFGMSK